MNSGDGGTARQGEPQCLCNTTHGIGRSKKRAGSAGGAGAILQFSVGRLIDLTVFKHAKGLCKGGGVGSAPVKLATARHGSSYHHNGRKFQTRRRHEHAGDYFIAGAQKHHAVKLMGFDHHLHIVGNKVTGWQDKVHPIMALGNPVTGTNNTEFHGGSPCLSNPLLHIFRNMPEIVMPRDHPVPGVGDSNEGKLQVNITVSH